MTCIAVQFKSQRKVLVKEVRSLRAALADASSRRDEFAAQLGRLRASFAQLGELELA